MIRSRIGVRDNFGDRLRSSRQRLRQRGQKLTQADLAKAVGVERNTVSRWENGSMLPKDPAVIASLAEVLDVTADWLIAGERAVGAGSGAVGGGATKLLEGSSGQYADRATGELPARLRGMLVAYLDRLREGGCPAAQVSGAESLLLAGARNRVSSTAFEDRSEDQVCADIDAAWDLVVRILRRDGIRL